MRTLYVEVGTVSWGWSFLVKTLFHLDPNTLPNEEPARKIKIIQKHVKKSKLLLNRYRIDIYRYIP
jgi:hypothetical protein